jgi:FixJ family two-component response regulator
VAETVFLVDDDAAVVKAISRLLRASGFSVTAFSSAREFMDSYQPGAAGCVVLDLSMPGITGLELQRWLADRNSSLPVLFLTGSDEFLQTKDSLKLDPTVEILMKPIAGSAFLKSIENALARNRQIRRPNRPFSSSF